METLSKDKMCELWSTNGLIYIKGVPFYVKKMSYGSFFLEPTTWKGGETDGFSPHTIWPEKTMRGNRTFYTY